MLSVEIANRIHPSLDFFEEHLEEVKEYALVTIAQLEEVKLFLKRQNVKREKSNTKRNKKKKKKKSKEQEQQQQESFGVSDDENENENENDETSDDDENVFKVAMST